MALRAQEARWNFCIDALMKLGVVKGCIEELMSSLQAGGAFHPRIPNIAPRDSLLTHTVPNNIPTQHAVQSNSISCSQTRMTRFG